MRAARPLSPRDDGSGIWGGDVAGIKRGDPYKYHVVSADGRYEMAKADPFARGCAGTPGDGFSSLDPRIHVVRRRLDGGPPSAQRSRCANVDL